MSARQIIKNAQPAVFTDNKRIQSPPIPVNKRQSDIEPAAL